MYNKKYAYFLYLILVFSIIAGGCFLRLYLYYLAAPLNGDEANQIIPLLQNSIFTILFKDYAIGENIGPLLLLTHKLIANAAGINLYSVRFISVLSGIVSCVLFYFFAQIHLKKKFSILTALFLFSFNITAIYYSAINKPCIIDITLSVLMLFIAGKYFINRDYSNKQLIYFSLTGIILYFYSLPMVIIFPSIIIVLIIKHLLSTNKTSESELNKKKNLYITGTINIYVIALYYIFYLHNIHNENTFHIWKCEYGFFPNTYKEISEIISFLFESNSHAVPSNNIIFVISMLALFILGLCSYILTIIKNRQDTINICNFLTIIIPVVITLCAAALYIYPFQHHVILFLLPSFIIIIAKTADFIDKKNIITGLVFISLFVSAYKYTCINRTYEFLFLTQKGHINIFRDIYDYLKKNLKEEDIIYVEQDMFLNIYVYNHIYNYKHNNILYEYNYKNLCQINDNRSKYILSQLKDKEYFYTINYTLNPSYSDIINEYLEKNYRYENIMGDEYIAILRKYTKN